MVFRKGVTKGVIAVVAGVAGQRAGVFPVLAFGGELAPLGRFFGFVAGAVVGLLVGDLLHGDLSPNKPVLGFAKGASSAVGGALGLLFLADVTPFVVLCDSPLGPVLTDVAGACYAYLELVSGTFLGVVVGDVLLAPFSG